MGWDILPNRGFILERLYPHQEHERSGLSQLGGAPLLPEHYPWPRYAEDLYDLRAKPERPAGQPFHFVAQIDLESLTHDKSTSRLPKKGMLYFFADLTMSCYMNDTDTCRVLYYNGPRSELKLTHAPKDTPIIIGKEALSYQAEGLAVHFKNTFAELPCWPVKLTAQETLPREDPWAVMAHERELTDEEKAFLDSLEEAFPRPPEPEAADFPDETFPYNARLAQIFLLKLKEFISHDSSKSEQLKTLVENLISPPDDIKKKEYIQKQAETYMIACDIETLIQELNDRAHLLPITNQDRIQLEKICQDVREKVFQGQKELDSAKLFTCRQGLYYLYALDRDGMLKTCAPALEVLSRFDRPYPAESQISSAHGYHHQFFGHPNMPQNTCLHEQDSRPPQHLLQIDSDEALLRSLGATLYFWIEQGELMLKTFSHSRIEFIGT